MSFIVSATTRDSEPEAREIPWTRQLVTDEETAKRIAYARNRAEQAANGDSVWGYYPATESDLESMRESDGHVDAGEEATRPPYDC